MEKEPKAKRKRKKKSGGGRKKPLWRRIIRWILILVAVCIAAGAAYVGFVIFTSPEIDPDNIYADLQQTSKIFDDQGELLEYVDASIVRTNVKMCIRDRPPLSKRRFVPPSLRCAQSP